MILRFLLVTLLSLVVLTACDEDDAMALNGFDEQEILDARKAKDEAFRGDESPLPPHVRESFKGLAYYEPDPDFAVEAVFTPSARVDTFTMATTTREMRTALRVGRFAFTLRDRPFTLQAYQFVDGGRESYFVPFTDATNGGTTYKAGRYLDVRVIENDSLYVLDFNMAYNPYCAYDESFSCPIVPRENDLAIPVAAGEKK